MEFVWIALLILMISAFLALALNKKPRLASKIGLVGAISASIAGLIPACSVLFYNAVYQTSISWVFGFDDVHLGIDPLSAFFLMVILITTFSVSIFGYEYLLHWIGKKSIGVFWFFFNLLVGSLICIVIARNGLFFLVSWEVMSVASFFLVAYEDEKRKVRHASLIYLIAANISSAFLIPFFILLDTGSVLNFDQFTTNVSPSIFLLAFVGFGIKAGYIPFHIWLPLAHPAAPSNVSAFMSGVMIKMGIYGLLRMVTFVPMPPAWWGSMLVLTGIVSGILGISFAVKQNNLKRFLAYSSIEHIGIIVFAIGLGILGISFHQPLIALLGIGGALFHVLNHSLFKSLLFMGSGAIYHATGSLDINHLGGLIKKMPKTAFYFLIGVLAISSIPVLNGFFSEFMIYLAAFRGMMVSSSIAFLFVILALSIIGALTLAAFSGIFSTIFLGEPRSNPARNAHEIKWPMQFSLGLSALLCFCIVPSFLLLISFFSPAIGEVAKVPFDSAAALMLQEVEKPIFAIIVGSMILIGVIALAFFIRKMFFKKRIPAATVTWDCGYVRPTPRMQYTFSSFVQPLMSLFQRAVPKGARKKIFPDNESVKISEYDPIENFINNYVLNQITLLSSRLRWIQHGYLNLYILYIFVTLLFLLIFKFG